MKKDRTWDTSGFTLIEIIMVIVILGILAAIVVPRFFSFADEAETESEASFIGRLKAGIHMFGANRLMETGARHFPYVQTPLFTRVLDEIPDDWEYTQSNGKITHTRKDGSTKSWYYWINADSTEFEIRTTFSQPPPPP
jgi:prepilin-type N-terminal cleavage/methylation domain-containing protein